MTNQNNSLSITLPFVSDEDAWLTGLTTSIAVVVPNGRPLTVEEFQTRYQESWPEQELKMNLGRDEDHGIWHIVGWRMGTYLVMLTEWDITQVSDDNAIAELWASVMDDDPEVVAATVAEPLQDELGVEIVMMGPKESAFFKRYQK